MNANNSNVAIRGMGMIPISNFSIGTALNHVKSNVVYSDKQRDFTQQHMFGECQVCHRMGWGKMMNTLVGEKLVCIRNHNACGKRLATWIGNMSRWVKVVK